MTRIRFALVTVCFAAFIVPIASYAAPPGIKPVGVDGKLLNLDFETGDLRDWKAWGRAFEGQPIKGDTVSPRRGDMKSAHQGNYWIGGFEKLGDDPKGTLTSAQFKVTHPWAGFLVAGGASPGTRVELVRADNQEIIFKTSGAESETLRPVVVDLQKQLGREIFIRVVDDLSGPWGHVNFDDFEFYAQRPKFDNEFDPLKIASEAPPADIFKFAGVSPEKAAEIMTLPPGFKATLFAGEPDVQQPIAFAMDHRGRLWVAEGFTYPIRHGKPQDNHSEGADHSKPTPEQLKDIFGGDDRILVLEDTNGDGKFDRRTVFLEHLNLVSGLEFGFGGVWIGAAPYLMFVPIQDGDAPKPAGDPQILLDGWNYNADTHETLNTFTWGPDGWLYGCHGVFCPSFVSKPGTPQKERQRMDAGVWRYHPTKRVFEVFAEGTSNPWGVDFDEYGQCFIEACVIPHLWHMIQGGRFERQGGQHFNINREETLAHAGYHSDANQWFVNPFIYDDIKTIADHLHYAGTKGPHAGNGRSAAAGGGHAHAGMMVYLGDSWPEQYRGKLFMNNIHGACINMDVPERQGSGFVGHHAPNFIDFNDQWSQVLNLQYDQNGSVYMIDWYDKNQCHHTNPEGHDRSNGRIFKIVYGDTKWTPVNLEKLSDTELVKLVPSNNEWMSRHARRVLQERFDRDAFPPFRDSKLSASKTEEIAQARFAPVRDTLVQLARNGSSTEARLRALWALHVTTSVGQLGFDLLGDANEWLRGWTIQVLSETNEELLSQGLRQVMIDPGFRKHLLKELVRLAHANKSPVVRLYLASALQRIPVEQRWDVLNELVQHAEDATDHNLPLMYWYAAEPAVGTDSVKAIALLKKCKIPIVREFIARRLATTSLKTVASN
ncbi:MAG TPA: PVC-type heme-binding CxxCH protein [Candidatus Angelobacter sp.]|nr:PVC-type heme-binding CxxCH protein [Candidatus Angelobacter sp.]